VRPLPLPTGPNAVANTKVAATGDTFQSGPGPARYEVTADHKLSANELAEIRKKNPELATAIQQAQISYGSLLAQGAKLVATTSPGNGNKPVLSIVPPSLAKNGDATKPYNVEIHYHGMEASAGRPNPSSPLTQRIADSFKKDPPTVYVLPEWNGTNDWSNVRNTGTTAQDGTRGIVGAKGQLTVSAHSLGRAAVLSAIDNGGLKADRLDIEDAFYSTQASGPQKVAKWASDHPDAKVRVLTTSTGMSNMELIKRQATWPSNVSFDNEQQLGSHYAAVLRPW
jgi:hypothetical protein